MSELKMLSEISHDKAINLETTVRKVQHMLSSRTRSENTHKIPRVHSRVTRNNTPGLPTEKSIAEHSEGEHNNENSRELATSEDEELNPAPNKPSTW